MLDACRDCCPNDNETFQPFRPALYSLLWYVPVHACARMEGLVGCSGPAIVQGIRSQGIIFGLGSHRLFLQAPSKEYVSDTRVET